MITVLKVNECEITAEYDLDVNSVYLGDLESEYVEIVVQRITTNLPTWDNGTWVNKSADITRLIEALEMEESLKLILRDRMESIE